MIPYRYYQQNLANGIDEAWRRGHRNVLAVSPTGSGKTVLFSGIVSNLAAHVLSGFKHASCVIAHREELVGQISLALNKSGVAHRIIAPNKTVKRICALHIAEHGYSKFSTSASCAVAGVLTLKNRKVELARWLSSVGLWVIDEAHHAIKGNTWGDAVELFPNAQGLGVTATPCRASGQGLGRHADGVFDVMVGTTREAPGYVIGNEFYSTAMRDMIDDGWLTDFKSPEGIHIYVPPASIDTSDVPISAATGDFNAVRLRKASKRSPIVGDVVEHYQRIAPGKLGVTFATDVEDATNMSQAFNAAGVPAEVVSAKTPDDLRADIMRRYRSRQLLMLVNVDLFGEGFDLPAIEVVIMARPTASYALYCQQFGRALRLMLDAPPPEGEHNAPARLAAIAASKKPYATIVDHVGNVIRHGGPPDTPRLWTLDRAEKRTGAGPKDVVPFRNCLNPVCMAPYERFYPECPYCGHAPPPPADRSAPEQVDGDLTQLDPAALAAMRAAVERVDMSVEDYSAELVAKRCPPAGVVKNAKAHAARQDAQHILRDTMARWAGYHKSKGRSDAEIHRRFFFTFGADAVTVQTLNPDDAHALTWRIVEQIGGGIT